MHLTKKQHDIIPYILFFGSAILFATMDIYVPSLPDMQTFFNTTEDVMQWTLTVNFMATAILGLFFGPVSDRFGRKKLIQIGVVIYLIGTIMCIASKKIDVFMIGRLLQAFGSSAQSVIGMAIIADLFSGIERAKIIAITGIIYPIAFSSAPFIGGKLSEKYGWQASFVFVFLGVFIYFVLFSKYIPETLKPSSSKKFLSLKSTFVNYSLFLKNRLFLLYASIHTLTIAVFMLHLANSSFFYKNQMGLPMNKYIYLQAIPCIGQIAMTFLSKYILKKYGMRSCFKMGGIGYGLGFLALALTAIFFPTNPYIVCGSICIPYVSSTFVFAISITKATEIFPDMAATSSGLFSFLRTIIGVILLGFGIIILDTTVEHVYSFMALILAAVTCSIFYILKTTLKEDHR